MQIEIVNYSEKSFAVFGEGTKELKNELMAANGKYNRHLRHPAKPDERTPGYIFSNKRRDAVTQILNSKLN